MEELNLPEFLFAEFPIKDGGGNDQRMFIVHRGISLIEVIAHDEYPAFVTFDGKVSKQYSYFDEEFTLVYHTNNVEYHGLDPLQLLDNAFDWYRDYMIWEDTDGRDSFESEE